MPVYELQEEHKPFLRNKLGNLYTGGTQQENCEKLLESREGDLFVVGDYSAERLLEVGARPSLIVYDGRTNRKAYDADIDTEGYTAYRARNPANQITVEAYDIIGRALHDLPAVVEIDGEEDLLTLAVIHHADIGDNVVYGDPGIDGPEGIRCVPVDQDVKQQVDGLLDR